MDLKSQYLLVDETGSCSGILVWDGFSVIAVEKLTRSIALSDFGFNTVESPSLEIVRSEVISFCSARKIINQACEVHQLEAGVGRFFPRIARVGTQHPMDLTSLNPDYSLENRKITESYRNQLVPLISRLKEICHIIHPEHANLSAFGSETRSLLILACTEVEAMCRGVMIANGYDRPRFSTIDYVKLARPMRLGEYEVRFPFFPWLGGVVPFSGWKRTGMPTQDLSWYNAYNQVKHDRERNFPLATLENCFLAVAGCVVLLSAQFGIPSVVHGRREISEFFSIDSTPEWSWSEVYVDPNTGYRLHSEERIKWQKKNYNFD